METSRYEQALRLLHEATCLRDKALRLLDAANAAPAKPKPDLSTPQKRTAFYQGEYQHMTTAERCEVQGDGFLNDYD